MSKILTALAFTFVLGVTLTQAADIRQRQAVQPQYQERQPLRQIPVVGTVVYGGLNYAGSLILSPLELISPRR